MQNKDNMWKDTFQLFIITLVAACLLGLVYEVTKEPIAQAKYNKKQEAYQTVYAEAASFEESEALTAAVGEAKQLLSEEGFSGVYISEALEAKDAAGETLGYVMNFGSNEGYGGAIDLSCGVTKDGTLTGLSVLSMSETAGLGAKCTEEAFLGQFSGLGAKEAENGIDAISGATITTTAITKAVNGALAFLYANGELNE